MHAIAYSPKEEQRGRARISKLEGRKEGREGSYVESEKRKRGRRDRKKNTHISSLKVRAIHPNSQDRKIDSGPVRSRMDVHIGDQSARSSVRSSSSGLLDGRERPNWRGFGYRTRVRWNVGPGLIRNKIVDQTPLTKLPLDCVPGYFFESN